MVAAVCMARDEADIIEHTVTRMLAQADVVIVADNLSRDGTREILERLPVTVVDDTDPAYRQSEKMTALAAMAIEMGAEWVIPFDADEAWHARAASRVADALQDVPDGIMLAAASLWDHVPTGMDPDDPDPVRRIAWRRPEPASLPKVACRAAPGLVIHQGNHGASYPGQDWPLTIANLLTVRHFPYRTAGQFVSKARNGAAAYAATDLPEHQGAHWRGYGRVLADHGEEACADIFRKWFWRADPDVPVVIEGERQEPLVFDPCP